MSIRFLLVLKGFETYLVTTPFAETWQLQQWLNGINAPDFIDDPLANLPPRSFANFVMDAVEEDREEHDNVISPSHRFMREAHGTMMVDDNKSIFYMTKERSADWKLPFCISCN